jgi:tRNA A-37 threonylcarbamoyl transferase component Bud32
MRLQFASGYAFPRGLSLPWEAPLEEWDVPSLVRLTRGISRNLVRFISYRDVFYAIKEINERLAVKEYQLLRDLVELGLPVVEPVALVTERTGTEKGLLVTRYLDGSLPLRALITEEADRDGAERLMDAVALLLVRLHLEGFFWGDCSLSNTLFRRDAGQFAAYLVDAETGELHPELCDGQRRHDLLIASENLGGELLDLQAGFGLADCVDPVDLALSVIERYDTLWDDISRVEEYPAEESWRIDARLRHLNSLGFDVQEMEIETLDDGRRLLVKAQVVENGYHRRLVRQLTGLTVEENQARRLLNDMYSWQASHGEPVTEGTLPGPLSAYRWYHESYLPLLGAVPEAERRKLDDAELFHQIMEHRWYMSEEEGRPVALEEVVPSYVERILKPLPQPRVEPNPLSHTGAA